jgi:hypothetical protein
LTDPGPARCGIATCFVKSRSAEKCGILADSDNSIQLSSPGLPREFGLGATG